MDCYRAQQLMSPYLDQQLTGAQMLEMQQHMDQCRHCDEEYRAARQIKSLLRSLGSPNPGYSLETRILHRLAQEDQRPEFSLAWTPPRLTQAAVTIQIAWPAPVPRGRRLAAALALSCLAVLTVAAPFAPGTANRAIGADNVTSAALGEDSLLEHIPSAGLRAAPVFGSPLGRSVSVNSTAPEASAVIVPFPMERAAIASRQYVTPPLTEAGAEPLGDEAATGYVSLVGYRR